MHRASSTAIASAEVSHYADLMAQRLAKQENMASEASSSMSAINTAIMQVSASATQVATLAESAQRASHDNHDALADIIQDMSDVAERSGQALDMLTELNDKIERVRSVTSMIEGVAEQTHLLSLNASIEAARAGEHGRGFAVVAEEVRRQARQSAEAAHQVQTLIETARQRIEAGQHKAGSAGDAMGRIRQASHNVNDLMEEIRAAAREQSEGIAQISQAIAQIDQGTQESATSMDAYINAVDLLSREVSHLAHSAHAFMPIGERQPPLTTLQGTQPRQDNVLALPPRKPAPSPLASAASF